MSRKRKLPTCPPKPERSQRHQQQTLCIYQIIKLVTTALSGDGRRASNGMDINRETRKLFEENRRITDGHQYTVPSGDHYPYQWLWDSCFHAIVLARYDVESAKAEIHSLLSKQFSNGLVPHIIYWTPGILHLFHWGTDGTSSLTQPPMLAYAAWEIHRREPDTSFLASIFPALVAYYNYLLSERDPHGHHLASIRSDARVRRVGDTPPRAGHIVPRLYFSRARCVLQLSSFRARPARASSCEHHQSG